MIEFTLDIGQKVIIGGDVVLEILEKTHPKAITAQVARIGIEAPENIIIGKQNKFLSELNHRKK